MRAGRISRAVGYPAAVAACVLGLAAVPGTAAAHGSQQGRGCVTLEGLREVTHLTMHDGGAPGPGAGDLIESHNELFDARGRLFGTSDGTIGVYAHPVTGELWEWVVATDRLPGGKVVWAGQFKLGPAVAGEVVTLPATGVSGKYKGKTGERWFRLVDRPAENSTELDSGVSLCRRRH